MNIINFPTEILLHIFSYFSPYEQNRLYLLFKINKINIYLPSSPIDFDYDIYTCYKNTYKSIYIKPLYDISYYIKHGIVEMFVYYKQINIDLHYCIFLASKYCQLNILKFLYNNYPSNFFISNINKKFVIDYVAGYGDDNIPEYKRIMVLDWWFNTLYKHKHNILYTSKALDYASKNGDINILNWFYNKYKKKLILNLHYTSDSVLFASEYNHIKALDWWLDKGHTLEFKYCFTAIDVASQKGNIDVLKWWVNAKKNNHIPYLKYTLMALMWVKNIETKDYIINNILTP